MATTVINLNFTTEDNKPPKVVLDVKTADGGITSVDLSSIGGPVLFDTLDTLQALCHLPGAHITNAGVLQ